MESLKEKVYALGESRFDQVEGKMYVKGDIIRETKDMYFIECNETERVFSNVHPDPRLPHRFHLEDGGVFKENTYSDKETARREVGFRQKHLFNYKCSDYVDIIASGMFLGGVAAIPILGIIWAMKILDYLSK